MACIVIQLVPSETIVAHLPAVPGKISETRIVPDNWTIFEMRPIPEEGGEVSEEWTILVPIFLSIISRPIKVRASGNLIIISEAAVAVSHIIQLILLGFGVWFISVKSYVLVVIVKGAPLERQETEICPLLVLEIEPLPFESQ